MMIHTISFHAVPVQFRARVGSGCSAMVSRPDRSSKPCEGTFTGRQGRRESGAQDSEWRSNRMKARSATLQIDNFSKHDRAERLL
ncbi:hypothetical protein J6590_058455 [Homalodisca vitripennis]|nr:hypothetical protein J6590_058455 [Homalodisca vitripennis]